MRVNIPLSYLALAGAGAFLFGKRYGERLQLKKIAWAQYRSPADVQTDYLRRKREEEVLG